MYDTNTSAAVYGLQSVKHPNQISEYQWGDLNIGEVIRLNRGCYYEIKEKDKGTELF